MNKIFKISTKTCLLFGLPLLFLLIPTSNQGAVQPAKDGAAYLRLIGKRYKDVRYFRAKFKQTSIAPGVIKREKASGIVYLRKDGKFRWDYDKPEFVLIVSDGKTLWIYQAEDKQVVVDTSFRTKMKRFPYSFLKRIEHLSDDFKARILYTKNVSVTLELIPKKHLKQVSEMQLTFNKKTFLISKIQWTSQQNVKTTISLNDIDITSKIPDSAFSFEVPEGVDIVNTNTP